MRKLPLIVLAVMCTQQVCAQTEAQKLKDKVALAADKIEAKSIGWRRDFHEHPELGNREFRTGNIIAEHLKSLGIEVDRQFGRTGVVGILRGGKPGPCVALRADMDGLPIVERVQIPFASKVRSLYNGDSVGVMHACGHDSHVSMLMAAAEILAGMKADIHGTVKFIFQPAEEGPPNGEDGGAELMVRQGVMDNPKVDAVFGMHIESNIEVGHIEYKPGPFMAASDWFHIVVKGKGSHGSQPWLGIDPIQISAQIITGLQNIVSRQEDLTQAPVVITVGKINGGVRSNIIPEQCVMDGTIRTLDSAMQQDVHRRIRQTVEKIAEANGTTATVDIDTKTLVTFNNPDLLQKIIPALQSAAGASNIKPRGWVTGAEDFSYYGTKAPAVFLYLGGMPKGNDPKLAPPHHTADFYIDDSGMKTGVKAYCDMVIEYMLLK